MQDETCIIPLSDQWWSEQARLFGTTRIQTQFARIMVGARAFGCSRRLARAQGDHATQFKREFDAVIHPPKANYTARLDV